jgi:hypothetical protein
MSNTTDTEHREDRNPFIGRGPVDTMTNVVGVLRLLGRVDDSEDVDESALWGRYMVLEAAARALNYESARIQNKRKDEADVLREQAEQEAAE